MSQQLERARAASKQAQALLLEYNDNLPEQARHDLYVMLGLYNISFQTLSRAAKQPWVRYILGFSSPGCAIHNATGGTSTRTSGSMMSVLLIGSPDCSAIFIINALFSLTSRLR